MRDSLEELRTVGIAGEALPAPGRAMSPVPLTESQTRGLAVGPAQRRGVLRVQRVGYAAAEWPLDQAALEAALNAVIARHDALRGRFSQTGEDMLISPELRLAIPIQMLTQRRGADELCRQGARRTHARRST